MLATVRRGFVAASVVSLLAGVGPARGQDSSAATHPVVHLEILGADAPRLQRFYADLFGWKITLNPVGYGYVPVAPTQPVTLTGGIGPSPQGQPLAVFYVKVDDPVAILKKVEALGGRTVVPPVDVPGGITFARFADPEGNVIGIVRRKN
jgi:predicted enzyme related to lactoylglutathione lyase